MLSREGVRHQLLLQRGLLLTRYHDALERADEDLDAHEVGIEQDPDTVAEDWYACVVASLSEQDLHALGDTIAALDRLEHGTYGICRTCGDQIDDEVLVDNCQASRCPECEVTGEVPIQPIAPSLTRLGAARTAHLLSAQRNA